MSDLVPKYPWEAVKQLNFKELRRMPCCEITGEENHNLGVYLMVPQNDFIKMLCENKGQLHNAVIPTPFPYLSVKKEYKPRKKRK